ncbi:MAG: hypothetical protein ACD_23C00899G0005 [uncultured bacterium]|nr:MAG: hypothetical protein ACD_23C00899G0005 [uncultured bacterium]
MHTEHRTRHAGHIGQPESRSSLSPPACKRRVVLSLALAAVAAGLGPQLATAADYPSKPISIVVPFSSGSATDKLARLIGEGLSKRLGQPAIVENRAGASGFLASTHVARSAPDGYTILITANTTQAGNPALFRKLPYDPVKDFAPLTKLGTTPLAMVIHPSIPADTVAQFIDYARRNPGKIYFGSGSTSARVAGEMLKSAAGIDIANVQYKSNPEAVTDLTGGHIQFMIADAVTTLPLANAGRVKALAVSTSQPTDLAPGLPTIERSGNLPGYEFVGWFAAYAPAQTPEAVLRQLTSSIRDILRDPSIRSKMLALGIEAESSTPMELAAFQVAETAKWKKLVEQARIPIQ